MIGQGILPQNWHPIADQLDQPKLQQFLDMLEAGYGQDAARMPDHAAYIAKFAPMKQAEVTP